MKKKIVVGLVVLVLLPLFYIYIIMKPTNQKNWEVGMERLPHIVISGDQIMVEGVRDFRYDSQKILSFGYISKTINLKNLTQVWLVVEPFSDWGGVAHTYFVFDFEGQEPLVISVEARRQKGQTFSVYQGALNQFTLIYIWGTEKDETIRRVALENNRLFMYPLKISQNGGQNLLLQMAKASQALETKPRFYNTFLNNCTSELAYAANKAKPGAIPWNIALYFPGYSPEVLYKLGYIKNDLPLTEVKRKYFISDIVKKIYQDENFSEKLRATLLAN